MTKAKNGRMLRWAIGTGIVLLAAYGGFVTTLTVYGKDISQTADDVSELATEGCAPAQAHTTDIALIQRDIEYIKDGIEAILKEMRAKQSNQATKSTPVVSSSKGPKT